MLVVLHFSIKLRLQFEKLELQFAPNGMMVSNTATTAGVILNIVIQHTLCHVHGVVCLQIDLITFSLRAIFRIDCDFCFTTLLAINEDWFVKKVFFTMLKNELNLIL